jgi:hypothetical protein
MSYLSISINMINYLFLNFNNITLSYYLITKNKFIINTINIKKHIADVKGRTPVLSLISSTASAINKC